MKAKNKHLVSLKDARVLVDNLGKYKGPIFRAAAFQMQKNLKRISRHQKNAAIILTRRQEAQLKILTSIMYKDIEKRIENLETAIQCIHENESRKLDIEARLASLEARVARIARRMGVELPTIPQRGFAIPQSHLIH
jgi:hypothetical protein